MSSACVAHSWVGGLGGVGARPEVLRAGERVDGGRSDGGGCGEAVCSAQPYAGGAAHDLCAAVEVEPQHHDSRGGSAC